MNGARYTIALRLFVFEKLLLLDWMSQFLNLSLIGTRARRGIWRDAGVFSSDVERSVEGSDYLLVEVSFFTDNTPRRSYHTLS